MYWYKMARDNTPGFLNIYDKSGQVLMVAKEIEAGNLDGALMRLRLESGLDEAEFEDFRKSISYTVFQDREQALRAAEARG